MDCLLYVLPSGWMKLTDPPLSGVTDIRSGPAHVFLSYSFAICSLSWKWRRRSVCKSPCASLGELEFLPCSLGRQYDRNVLLCTISQGEIASRRWRWLDCLLIYWLQQKEKLCLVFQKLSLCLPGYGKRRTREETAHHILAEKLMLIPDFSIPLGCSQSCFLEDCNCSLPAGVWGIFFPLCPICVVCSSLLIDLKMLKLS